mgnify:CR=1 FL=1
MTADEEPDHVPSQAELDAANAHQHHELDHIAHEEADEIAGAADGDVRRALTLLEIAAELAADGVVALTLVDPDATRAQRLAAELARHYPQCEVRAGRGDQPGFPIAAVGRPRHAASAWRPGRRRRRRAAARG